jgi:succinate dehydrogenase / fumarate reductase cytochrome b subunit
MNNNPSPRNALRWFDPRDRRAGSWAFILNRLSALGLTFYLGLHLIVLNKLTQGPQAYDEFVTIAQAPLIKAGEILLVTAVVLHGLNGLRLAFLAFGLALRHQTLLFVAVMMLTIFVTLIFAIHIFGT